MAKRKESGCGFFVGLLVLVLFFVFVFKVTSAYIKSEESGNDTQTKKTLDSKKTKPSKKALLSKKLIYLSAYNQIAWYKIDDENVYIAFKGYSEFGGKELPKEYKEIANTAALTGSKALEDAKFFLTTCNVNVVGDKEDKDSRSLYLRVIYHAKGFNGHCEHW